MYVYMYSYTHVYIHTCTYLHGYVGVVKAERSGYLYKRLHTIARHPTATSGTKLSHQLAEQVLYTSKHCNTL